VPPGEEVEVDPFGADDRQARVADAIHTRSPKLAAMYRRTLLELSCEALPGDEVARVAVICHCIRELVNGLPLVLSDFDEKRPRPSADSLTKKLPKLLTRHAVDLALDQDIVPVPREVAHAFHRLVATAVKEEGRNKRGAAALVTGGKDTKHPAVKQWGDAYRFLVGWAHLDRNHDEDRVLPSDNEIRDVLRVFEDVIDVRTTAFFENVAAINDLLVDINASEEEGA
jgi:hypothetical protein